MLARAWKKGKPHAPLVGTKVFATSKEYNMEIPQKLKKTASIQSSNFTPGYLSEENENTNF